MPNIKSAKKRVLITEKKAAQNKSVKTALKTVLKKADAASDVETIKVAIKKVDQAAANHILHKNAAAHKKSTLMKKLAVASK